MSKYIKITAPKQVFDLKALDAEIQRLMVDVRHIFEADFATSMQSFSHKAPIRSRYSENNGVYRVVTSVDDENYARLNFGTKDHAVGQQGKVMVFNGFDTKTYSGQKQVYKPKSIPGTLKSYPGFPLPGTQRIARKGPWLVAGIKPRKYDELIIKQETPRIVNMTNKALANALGKG